MDPHILVKFLKYEAEDDSDPIASMIIFEWKDFDLIGVPEVDTVSIFEGLSIDGMHAEHH